MFTYDSKTKKTRWIAPETVKDTGLVLSHRVTHVRQFSNAWLIKCGCGELFTGKGISYPVSVRKHLHETVVTIDA